MSNNSLTDLTKFIEYSYTHKQPTDQQENEVDTSINHPYLAQPVASPPLSKDPDLEIPPHSISDALINQANELAKKTGEARDIVLSNLIKQNAAWLALQNFLITDLLVKGSLLTFNYWLCRQKNNDSNPDEA